MYTPPPDQTPHELIALHTKTQKKKLRTLLNRYKQSGEDVYAVVTGDWHTPDEDPVAMELALQVAEAWVAGQTNRLKFQNGDYACFPTLHKNNVVPFYMLYPDIETKGHYVWATQQHFIALDKAWHGIFDDIIINEGNHDNPRFFRSLYTITSETADISALQWIRDITARGSIWLGMNSHQLLLREDIKILHGNYALKNPGSTIMKQMESDGFAYNVTIQGHVHRSARVHKPVGHRQIFGYEVGCLQNIPPLYNTGRTENWVQGMLVMRYNPNTLDPPEIYNLAFTPVLQKDGRYLVCHLDGMEFRVKYPQEMYSQWLERTGVYLPGK